MRPISLNPTLLNSTFSRHSTWHALLLSPFKMMTCWWARLSIIDRFMPLVHVQEDQLLRALSTHQLDVTKEAEGQCQTSLYYESLYEARSPGCLTADIPVEKG